jgi:membrane protease YdiL (CAAX protease family)
MKALTNLQNDKSGLKVVFHAIMGVVLLIAGNVLASLPFDLSYLITGSEPSPLTAVLRPVLTIAVISLLVCLYIRKILKLPLQDFRIRKPKSAILWGIVAFGLPLAVSAFFIFLTPGRFSASGFDTAENTRIILGAVFSSCLTAGITEELVFRGLIMRVLEIRWGKTVAIAAPSVLFGLLHIMNMGDPNVVDILILAAAGSAVGVMFSMITLQRGSSWASAIVHGVWNLIIIGGILGIGAEPSPAIFNYALISKSTLLTGGQFGIEASLPAIIGYCAVIAIAVLLLRESKPVE